MKAFVTAALIASVLTACATAPQDPRRMDDKQAKELAELGSRTFGIQWEGRLDGARDKGILAVTDGTTTLTNRSGSRTYIVHNRKAFPSVEGKEFKGSDAELKSIGIKFLVASGAKEEEIADVQILQQFTQVGEKSPGAKEIRLREPVKGARTLLIRRRIGGVEVISSRLLLNADRDGRIAFMELSWPDFDSEVLRRAASLSQMADQRRIVPALEGAEVEAVQPVLLHSPAVGFYNDAAAAIRVIYRPNAKQVGQKAVRYINERGEDIDLPRDVDATRAAPARRTVPAGQQRE
jgi:hypothetical protein